ncbi:MAG: M18 family aminopeptidase [Leucobacter sp.]
MAEGLLANRDAYIQEFIDFVSSSPSSYHAARFSAGIFEAAGFTPHDETDSWGEVTPGTSGFVVRDGAIIAWRAGSAVTATSPVRVLGAHTDSPGFVLKPSPDFISDGWSQAGVEVYGGPLINSWLDRDLGFAGRIVTKAGEEHLVQTPAVARIPQLAIHLDRGVNNGLTLDKQRHVQPVLAVSSPDTSVLDILAQAANLPQPGDIVGVDVRLYDTQSGARIGANEEFLASARLDNLSSTFAGLVALIETEPAAGSVTVFASFDHEELGSETRSGASGPFLEEVLGRLRAGLAASVEDAARAMAASWHLSADAGHSVHPNYSEKHDPNVKPLAGQGPMLKVNANQRYATDAHGTALWQRVCETAGVHTQTFVSNNTSPCGSTIGPLTATRIGIRTVDVGVPLLSMHSARELAHIDDLFGLARVIGAFYAEA